MVKIPTLAYAREEVPKPTLLLWMSAAIVFVAAIMLVLGAVLALIACYTNDDSGYFITAIAMALAAALPAALEYSAMRLQSRLATMLIAVPLLIGGGLGLISLARGVLGLIGVLPIDREFTNWIEVWLMMGVVTAMSFIGITHLRWAWALKRWQARAR